MDPLEPPIFTYLVDKGEGAVLVGNVAHLLQGADGARHRVHRLEGHNLGDVAVNLYQKKLIRLSIILFWKAL